MSTSANLVGGQFITSIGGKRCTAVPKSGSAATKAAADVNGAGVQSSSIAAQATSSSTTSDSTSTTSVLVTSTSISTPASSTLITTTSTSVLASTFITTSLSTSTLISTSTSISIQKAGVGAVPQVQGTPLLLPPDSEAAPPPTTQATSTSAISTPRVQPQAQPQAQTAPVAVQASQADTGVLATSAAASVITASTAGAAAAVSAPAISAPAVSSAVIPAPAPGPVSPSAVAAVSVAPTVAPPAEALSGAASASPSPAPQAAPPAGISSVSPAGASVSPAGASVAPAGTSSVVQANTSAGSPTSTSAGNLAGVSTSQTATAAPLSITNGNGAAVVSTIAAPSSGGSSTAAAAAAGESNGAALSVVSSTPGKNPKTTAAVVGGVVGGLAILFLIAFLIWFWRRRNRKRRRSTLLTPLSTEATTFDGQGRPTGPTMNNSEKGEYVINRGSIGPTPKSERFKASLSYNIRVLKGRLGGMLSGQASSRGVNMDRGNSQFMDSSSRDNSSKGRFAGSGAGLANGQNEKRAMGAPTDNHSGRPDFLTLLGMDEDELERAAQNKRASKKRRASAERSRQGGSRSRNNNDYLDRLNVDLDNPFSDANTIARQSAKPAPFAVNQSNNPFSDANAVRNNGNNFPLRESRTYISDDRRSRGQTESMYRDSMQTVTTVDTKRNRFRSDPFDLERPERLQHSQVPLPTASVSAQAIYNTPGSRVSDASRTGEIQLPRAAHQRVDSYTSKYSSGVSLGDWAEPGPDVGASVFVWGDSGNTSSGRQQGGNGLATNRQKRNSDESSYSVASVVSAGSAGSAGSVGKAL